MALCDSHSGSLWLPLALTLSGFHWLSLALTTSLSVSLWLSLALCDSHSGSHWLSLPLSGLLGPSLAHFCFYSPWSALRALAWLSAPLPRWRTFSRSAQLYNLCHCSLHWLYPDNKEICVVEQCASHDDSHDDGGENKKFENSKDCDDGKEYREQRWKWQDYCTLFKWPLVWWMMMMMIFLIYLF